MLTKAQNLWLYVVAALVAGATAMAAVYNFFLTPVIPVFIGLLWLCISKPHWYISLICAMVPLSVIIKDVGFGLGMSVPTEPMILILFGILVFRFFITGTIPLSILKHPLSYLILFNLGWLLLSTLASSMPMVSFKFFLARTWYVVVFYFFLLYLFQNKQNIHRVMTALLFGTIIMVTYTVVRHAGEGFVRSHSYSIMKPFFPDHGMYAAAIAFFVPIALIYAVRGHYFNMPMYLRILFGGMFALLIVGIIFSYTRATWLSLVAALGFYVIMRLKISVRTLGICLGIIALVAFLNKDQLLYSLERNKQGSDDDISEHVQSVSNITTDPSNLERLNRWHCAILMFEDRPVFGFGPGTYVFQYAPYQRPEDLTIISTNAGDLGNTHSEYFNSLSETGLFGFLSWVGIFLLSVGTAVKVVYNTRERWIRGMAIAAVLGLLTYYIHAFLNNYSEFDKIAVPMWGFIALIASLDIFHNKPSQTTTGQ